MNHADIAQLIQASNSEEQVSTYENHTNDENESECSNKDFDTDIQQMYYKGNIQSNNHETKRKLDRLLPSSRLYSSC
ncbi:hypothetical protein TNCT_140351 [Trichonephila clavata]|uniref:Uncharacterized protein n=1 Tax=Trichonephila clavata TaxID=2740835 RepID=A0A8X6G2M6_TRICU|nr:hypothetical protein TNCT_140351 [Trichonephila clavata]